MPDVTAVITTYNQLDSLRVCLPKWREQGAAIIVSSDGSSNKEEERDLCAKYDAKYLWQEDAGFRQSMAFQRGLDEATTFWSFFTDADGVPSDGFLDALADVWTPGLMCSSRRRFTDGKTWQFDSRNWDNFDEYNPYYVSGSAMFCETDAIKDIGGWHDGYVDRCFLDWDVAIRWLFSGRKFAYSPDAIMSFHHLRDRREISRGAKALFLNRISSMVSKEPADVRMAFMLKYGINQGDGEFVHCLPN